MLLRLLETPLLDVLLIILLLRIFFPSLFGVKRRIRQKEEKEPIIRPDSSGQQQKFKKDQGEYIDYEEIK
ncbi:MAG TPA: hypothetical protein VE978_11880 [Chitinophagales bacterium]|nr:hypothetical protein [Chitinophagales bacterium]